MTDGRGGRRKGAGRPKGSKNGRTQRAAKVAESLTDDVEEALALLRQFMRNPELSARLRKDCAVELLDRSLGRPAQHKIVEKDIVWRVEYGDNGGDEADAKASDSASPLASEAGNDQAQPSETQGSSAGQALGKDDLG